MPIVLALGCAVLWGTADFCGGTASRRLPSATVLLWSSLVALPVIVILMEISGETRFTAHTIGWGCVAGLGASIGIVSLYKGLASGLMGVVAPIASTSVVVPVLYGLATGEDVPLLCGLGIAVAVVGVVLAGGPNLREFRMGGHRPVLLALGAAAGIGVSLVAVAAGSQESAYPTLVSMRVTYFFVLIPVVLLSGERRAPDRGSAWIIVLAGLGDISAVTLYGIATRAGSLPIVAAISSMFPVTTLFLARQIHHERLKREQLLGVAIALIGVVLVVTSQ